MGLTAVVDRPPAPAPVRNKRRRRRFRFSLNGLAIQLSAFALSSTLVALLVVTGSQAAFVEQNESVTEYVPIGGPTPTEGGARRPGGRTPAAPPAPTPAPTPDPSPAPSPAPTPAPTPEPNPEAPPSERSAPVPEKTAAPVPDAPATEIALTDSAAGTAMFGNGTLSPGVVVQRCIAVTYAGNTDPEAVRLFAAATSGDLAPYLDLVVHIGREGTGASRNCAGFAASDSLYEGTLAAFAATHSNPATGRTTWDPSDREETRTFRFSLTVRDDPRAAGKSASFGFSWRTEAS
jgi:hypothetical protein